MWLQQKEIYLILGLQNDDMPERSKARSAKPMFVGSNPTVVSASKSNLGFDSTLGGETQPWWNLADTDAIKASAFTGVQVRVL